MEQKPIETLVADAILERPRTVTVNSTALSVAPPSVATLILVSEAVSRLPEVRMQKKDLVRDSLLYAKECAPVADIAAILILGARRIRESRTPRKRKGLRGLLGATEPQKDIVAELSANLLESLTPHQLNDLTASLLSDMQLGDFFGLTTFLTEINLTKKTKVERQTASGQQ